MMGALRRLPNTSVTTFTIATFAVFTTLNDTTRSPHHQYHSGPARARIPHTKKSYCLLLPTTSEASQSRTCLRREGRPFSGLVSAFFVGFFKNNQAADSGFRYDTHSPPSEGEPEITPGHFVHSTFNQEAWLLNVNTSYFLPGRLKMLCSAWLCNAGALLTSPYVSGGW